jgi:hypothetical protein
MNRPTKIKYEFVDFIPNELEEETVYISIPYATSRHLCLCGCGHQVILPIAPHEWQLSFDGETVSFYPSVGNWSFDCRSHYWIENDKVIWDRPMSRLQIQAVRDKDKQIKKKVYSAPVPLPSPAVKNGPSKATLLGKICAWFRR